MRGEGLHYFSEGPFSKRDSTLGESRVAAAWSVRGPWVALHTGSLAKPLLAIGPESFPWLPWALSLASEKSNQLWPAMPGTTKIGADGLDKGLGVT